jgi:hypothetical protein
VKLWNDLDEDLKKLPWKSFKTELKKKMLAKQQLITFSDIIDLMDFK